MTTRSWRFTALEFYALWCSGGRETFLPWPFFYTTDIEKGSDFDAARRAALEGLRQRLDTSFDQVLETLIQPEIRLVASGREVRDPRNVEGLVRLLAARRGVNGYVVKQLPGKGFAYAGGFVVTETTAVGLGGALVGELPEARPGEQAEMVLPHRADRQVDETYGRSSVRDSFETPPGERAMRFLDAVAVRSGRVEISQGTSVFGPRGRIRFEVEWRDLDDGRYVIDDRDPPVASPADPGKMTAVIDTRIARVVRAIKDERSSLRG
ncbi:ESX secretion-associated protein EspG [Nocardia sp. NPDC003345]